MSSDTLSLSGSNTGYVINLATGTYAAAAKILPIGDSLTHGFLTPRDDDPDLETREGYRGDLFNLILAAGGWIDYVGSTQNGPADMLDPDHSATGGEELRDIVASLGILSDLSDNLAAHTPDITLLMAGTNDFGSQQFENRFSRIIENMGRAIDQFEDYAGNDDKYLVISTLAPKIRDGVPAEYAEMINRGYSIQGGEFVVGNVGNGTYQPGLIALVEAAHASNPNIILFNNPVGLDGLGDDDVHYTDAGYAEYAAALMALLQSEIGLVDGTFVNSSQSTGGAMNVEGSEAGDRITGNGGKNTIEGNGGRDYITLGGGADVVVYGASALDDMRDVVTDLSSEDRIDVSGLAAALGLGTADLADRLRYDEDGGGTELGIQTSGGLVRLAYFEGATEAKVRSAILLEDTDPGGGTGNDDTGNDDTGNDDTGNDDTGNDDAGNDDTGNDDTGNDDTGSDPVLSQLFGTDGRDTIVDDGDSTEIFGLEERDTIYGGDGDDTIEGGSGKDKMYGGAGADIFRFTLVDDDGQRDDIYDFDAAEGDRLDLSVIAAGLGLTAQQTLGAVDVDFIGNGIRVSFSASGFSENLAILRGLTAADEDDVRASILVEPGSSGGGGVPDDPDPPSDTTADADGNLKITIPDTSIDETEASNVIVSVTGIDADATAVVSMSFGGTTLTRALSADGSVSFDLSALPDGTYATAVKVTDAAFNQKTVAGATVTLSTPEPEPDPGPDLPGSGIDVPDGLPELVGTQGNDKLKGGNEDSAIRGLEGNDTLIGLGGRDYIFGGDGEDLLRGDTGDDVLIGGADRDTLRGNDGADTFVFDLDSLDGTFDRLDTWNAAEGDKIDISVISNAYGWSAAEAASYISFAASGNGVKVNLNAPEVSQTLVKPFKIDLSDISLDDFILV